MVYMVAMDIIDCVISEDHLPMTRRDKCCKTKIHMDMSRLLVTFPSRHGLAVVREPRTRTETSRRPRFGVWYSHSAERSGRVQLACSPGRPARHSTFLHSMGGFYTRMFLLLVTHRLDNLMRQAYNAGCMHRYLRYWDEQE